MGMQVITTKVAGHVDLEQFEGRVHFVETEDVDSIRELVDNLPHTFDLRARSVIVQTRSAKAVVDNIENKIMEVMK